MHPWCRKAMSSARSSWAAWGLNDALHKPVIWIWRIFFELLKIGLHELNFSGSCYIQCLFWHTETLWLNNFWLDSFFKKIISVSYCLTEVHCLINGPCHLQSLLFPLKVGNSTFLTLILCSSYGKHTVYIKHLMTFKHAQCYGNVGRTGM